MMWSMGNESGYGPNFAAISAWLHDFDPTRPVHYEGAQGVNGEPDPKTVDVISRFYTRVKQEYLNPGIPEGEDKERAENARWERLLEIAERTNDNRPVMTSEYAHCMGNALGNFKEYWDEIYSNHVCWAALYGTGWIKVFIRYCRMAAGWWRMAVTLVIGLI